ncbi:MAG: FkbM family methyltransferase [Opitutaceae bacterium]
MTCQRIMLRILRSGCLGSVGDRLMHRRAWTIESGEGAGLRFRVSHNPEFISGTSELPIQRAIASNLKAGDVFYDVGANLGFFSAIAARRIGPTGRTYAFEPVPENAGYVRENARINGFTNLETFELAVGAEPGFADFFLAKWQGGSSLLEDSVPATEMAGKCRVEVVTLDRFALAHGLRPPNFVKIDVEGAEHQAIEGMRTILKEFKPILLYEVDDASPDGLQRRWDDLDALVQSQGYQIKRITGSYPNTNWFVGHSLALP